MTPTEHSNSEVYITTHLNRVLGRQDIFGLEFSDLESLVTELSMSIEEDLLLGPWLLMLCDHPVNQDSQVLALQQRLKEESSLVVGYETLHHLFEVTLYAYAAYELGVTAPISQEEIAGFKEEHFKKDREIIVEGTGTILECSVKPIKFGKQTVYERKWWIRSACPTRCS